MNCYFVFEGKTELHTYRAWLRELLPHLSEVNSLDMVQNNHYYTESDYGLPHSFKVAANAIQDINESNTPYDYLVLFIDADRLTIAERMKEANEKIAEHLKNMPFQTLPEGCQFRIIVQKVCIETWFLGNRTFFVRTPQSELLRKYITHFDVSEDNPEEMPLLATTGCKTNAEFHERYLYEIFKERLNIGYLKARPKEVIAPYFLQQLQQRCKDSPTHLVTFQEFLALCQELQPK